MEQAELQSHFEKSQRIIQKQAVQIGNLIFTQTQLETENDILREKLDAANSQLSELRSSAAEADSTEKAE